MFCSHNFSLTMHVRTKTQLPFSQKIPHVSGVRFKLNFYFLLYFAFFLTFKSLYYTRGGKYFVCEYV